MNSPNPATVRAFWDHMSVKHGTRVIDKNNSRQMRLIGWFLERLGVLDAEDFLTRFTTVIGTRIYTPYAVGVSRQGHALWAQIVTCAHEHQHVIQLRREGRIRFFSRYLGSRAARAAYEAEAYTCNMELHHWYTGEILDPTKMARLLLDYGCRAEDVEVARKILIAAARTTRAGGVLTLASQETIAWLEKHAPGLKHQGSQ